MQPSSSHLLASQIPLQAKDGFVPNLDSKNEELGKYLTLKTLYSSVFSFLKVRHPCLENRAILKILKLLNPKLPRNFDVQI